MGIRNRLDRFHNRIFPLTSIWVPRKSVEDGGYPEELWGGVERLRRSRRTTMEIFLVSLAGLVGGPFVTRAVYGQDTRALAVTITVFAVVLISQIWTISMDVEQLLQKRALKAAKRDPGALQIGWLRQYDLMEIIDEHLEESLTEAEHEVAVALIGPRYQPDYQGSVGELVEISRELCRETVRR